MWLRTRLGAKVELDQFVEAQIAFLHEAEAGDSYPGDDAENREALYLDTGHLLLKHFVGQSFSLRIGRQPVAWNLRPSRGGFIYDSRAHYDLQAKRPSVTSWDGVRGYIQMGNMQIWPFAFWLNEFREASGTGLKVDDVQGDDNRLYGATLDWKADAANKDNPVLHRHDHL